MKHQTIPSSVLTSLLILASIAAGPASAENAAPSLSCDPLAGVDRLAFDAGTILLFGEIHGTAEAPALVADIACFALREGAPLRVGLELPHQDTASIETYLASAGSETDREELLSRPFWQREYQDGRSSRAMAELIEELRRWNTLGHPLTVTLFDSNEPTESSQARDRAMAERLARTATGHPKDLLLVLTGNIHARLRLGTPWDTDFEPMGYLLQKTLPERSILAFDLSSTGGTAWTCNSAEAEGCQARKLGGRGEGAERKLTLFEQADSRGFYGIYHVGAINASPPAVATPTSPATP